VKQLFQTMIVISAFMLIVLCGMKLASAEGVYSSLAIVLPDGTVEKAECGYVYYSEPAFRICESKHAICKKWIETDQEECQMKPVKN
jgi:hypothetical protein